MSVILDNQFTTKFPSIILSDGNPIENGSNFITLELEKNFQDGSNMLKVRSFYQDSSSLIEHSKGKIVIPSIASGLNPLNFGSYASAYGSSSMALGIASFAEGVGTLATGFAAHAAGFNTTASGYAAFSVGVETDADGTASFAAGSGSRARGTATVAFGIGTVASSSGQLVVGHYNETKTDINNIFVVGDGTSNSLRRNVIEVYGGQGASLRGVKIDTVSPSGPATTTIDGFNVYGRTIFYGGVTQSANIITIDNDYGGITHGSASYIAETYTSLGQLRGRTLLNYKGIDFNNSVQTTAPSSTHLWTNQLGELYYGSSAVILNNATNFTASNVTVSNVTVTGTASIAFLNVTYESASVIYSTGSNQFGDAANDTQTLYGSVVIPTGSLTVTGSTNITGSLNVTSGITGSLFGTSSWAQSASNALRSISASRADTASFLPVGTYQITSSWAVSASQALTASFVNTASTNAFVQGGNSFGTTALLGTNDTQDLQFETSGSVRMTISSSGRVGIGTTTPASLLHISSTSNYGMIRLSPTALNGESSIGFFSDTLGTDNNDAWIVGHAGWGNTGDFVIGNEDNGAGGNVRLLIEKSGNVGIGTTSPTSRLQVRGSGATSATTALRVENANASASLIVLDNGNVGIGTTTPSASLHVQGNFQISTGSLYTYGQNTDIDSGSFRTVITIPTSSYRAAFFDYVLTSGSNARAGTVFSVWQGTSVEYADTSTNDIGNTTGVNLLVSMSGANIGLFASSSNDNWSMKALARML